MLTARLALSRCYASNLYLLQKLPSVTYPTTHYPKYQSETTLLSTYDMNEMLILVIMTD